MEINVETRLKMYKEALRIIRHDIKRDGYYHSGFCYCLGVARINFELDRNIYDTISLYPEIWKYQPVSYRLFWWNIDDNGDKKRIAILKEAISTCKKILRDAAKNSNAT